MKEVFNIFGVDISFAREGSFDSSGLHLIFYLPPSDNVGNLFEPSLNKRPSPLQRFINKHQDGVSILHTCYDDMGYLPIHYVAVGGNFAAIKWYKNIGADTQLQPQEAAAALQIAIMELREVNTAELLELLERIEYSTSNRKEVFEELLEAFFTASPQFLCTPSWERLFPLRYAAEMQPAELSYVWSVFTPSLGIKMTKKLATMLVYLTKESN